MIDLTKVIAYRWTDVNGQVQVIDPGEIELLTDGPADCMPASKAEYRVRFIFQSAFSTPKVYTHDDNGWFGPTPDDAAAYPWLMNNAICWVERRTNYEHGPWETADIDLIQETNDGQAQT